MDWIIAAWGLLLFIAPFVLGFSASMAALWTCIVLGLVIALAAGYQAIVKDEARWEMIVAGIAGVLAVLAPFILGFTSNATAMWTSMIVGLIVAILAGWNYLQSSKTNKAAIVAALTGQLHER